MTVASANAAGDMRRLFDAGAIAAKYPVAALALSWLAVFALCPDVATGLLTDWSGGSHQMHALALPAGFILFAGGDFSTRTTASVKAHFLSALILLAAALLMTLGRAAGVDMAAQSGLALALIAMAGLLFGDRYLLNNPIAAAITLLCVPSLPAVSDLLTGTASFLADLALTLAGVDFSRSGVLFATDVGSFRVAEACAGFSQMVGLIVTAAILGRLRLKTLSARLLLLLIAAVAALAANVLRIAIIIAASVEAGDMTLAQNHGSVGLAIFAVALVCLTLAAIMVGESQPLRHPFDDRSQTVDRDPVKRSLLGLVLIAASSAYAGLVMAQATTAGRLAPLAAPGWRLETTTPPAENEAAFAHADEIHWMKAEKESATIYIAAARFTPDREGARITGYDTRLAAATLSDQSPLVIYDVDGLFYVSALSARLAITRARLAGAAPSGQAVFIMGDENEARILARDLMARAGDF